MFLRAKVIFTSNITLRYAEVVYEVAIPSSAVFQPLYHHMVTLLLSYGMLKIMSTEPDLNQRPRDIWFCVWSTVSRSTNWAIGGCNFEAQISPYSKGRKHPHIPPHSAWWMNYLILLMFIFHSCSDMVFKPGLTQGGLAQVVERSICIREAPGSIPGFSTFHRMVENRCYQTLTGVFLLFVLNVWFKYRISCIIVFIKLPRPGIEPGTFRSSVWRSPNWAISAVQFELLIYRQWLRFIATPK